MNTATKKTNSGKHLVSLKEEATETMLKRAGITKKDIYKVALTNWINQNLDLLTPSEQAKYKEIIL
ncbi:MAG: hypothetical protein LBF08_07155 [Dysgonamonadaceae bacterium]|jgi:hypothetical protein|nr:hypothetical protein [Dysgonamonadaceae bacterium]